MANVGIVTTWFDRGASFVSKALIDALIKEHRVFVYARGGESYGQGSPIWEKDYVTWGKRLHYGIPMFISLKDFNRWIIGKRIDVLLFNEQQSWDVILKIKKMNITIGSYIDYYTHKTVPLFGLFDFLICNTERHFSVFKKHPQCIYIPWGTDLQVFKPGVDKEHHSEVCFFHSSGMSPYRKGTDLLVKAFNQVVGEAKLIIHSQVNLDSDLLDVINRDPRIELVIKTINPPGLYYRGDVYVYPSRLDGIGLTIAEALASGLPVITTDNAPMNEFISPGINGVLVKVEKYQKRSDNYYWDESICDLGDLRDKMQSFVSNPKMLRDYKYNARVYAENSLDWSKNSKPLSTFINQIKKIPYTNVLLGRTAWYEYSRYPGLILNASLRKLGRLKHS